MKCKLNTDMWQDVDVVYLVHSYSRREESTGVILNLEYPDGTMETRTVAIHEIEWIEEDES
jgi:hypothetical protein